MNPLLPFANAFRVVVTARNALYDRGVFHPQRLAGPVVSVGNIAVGGAGKTPFLILLGELLRRRGVLFDVLSRGYGRQTRGVALVAPEGSARDFGDEPLLIARTLPAPVIVGEERLAAGRFAEQRFGPQLHLLDDAFQHRQLARDFDIVLVTPGDAGDRLLPAGRLREPLSALRRADAVVLAHDTAADALPLRGKLVWRTRRGIALEGDRRRPLAFCGIARPERFFADLRERGVSPAREIAFRDHHVYREADVARLRRAQRDSGADGFLTTQKDVMNLGPLANALAPLGVARVTLEWEHAEEALDQMLHTIAERKARRA